MSLKKQFMSFIKDVETKQAYTVEEMLNLLKTRQFSGGVPEVTSTATGDSMISFPAADLYNQVYVIPKAETEDGRSKNWTICNGTFDNKNIAAGIVLDGLTGGLAGLGSFIGGNAKKTSQMVDEVVNTIIAMEI